MTPAERLSGRMPSEADIDAIARRTLERLPSPFADRTARGSFVLELSMSVPLRLAGASSE